MFQEKVNEPPEDMPEVINDFDIEEDEIAIENRYMYTSNICHDVNQFDIYNE